MKKLIRIEYWDKSDICGFGYSTGYKNVIYVPAIIHERDYPYMEEGVEDGDREFIATFQKVKKEYITSKILVTPSERNALELIQLHKYIRITIGTKSQAIKYFRVEGAKSVEAYEFEEITLRFQVDYDVRTAAEVIEPRSALLDDYYVEPVIDIYPTENDVDVEIYDGARVVFTDVEYPDIYTYSSNTGEWVQTGEAIEDSWFFVDETQYYYNGLDFNQNAEMLSVGMVSGTTYLITGNSRMGYVRIEGSSDGGGTWLSLEEGYSGTFNSLGISVDLDGVDLIRAVFYEHGGDTYTGEEVISPTADEYLSITQSLTDFETDIGSYSDSQNFTIVGTGSESTDVVVTAPTSYEVSLDDISFSSSVTVTYAGGIPLTTIYVRLEGETTGVFDDYVTLVVDDKTYRVAVNGDVYCDIQWISDYLDIINGEVIDENIEDRLDYLLETKSEIADAIEDAGGTIDPSDTFRDYATRIGALGTCVWEAPFEF